MDSFIDIYCERLEPGLWAEPLNAVTNASFFIAALFCWLLAKKRGGIGVGSWVLIGFLLAIGTGSTLFHTTAQYWAMLSDTLPILFYQIAFLYLYSRGVMGLERRYSLGLLGLFGITVVLFGFLPQGWLNGSISYIPPLMFLAGLAVWHWKHAHTGRGLMAEAVGIFVVSLTLRSSDMHMCEIIPFGTHFMWHVLNGVVLYLTTRAYILNSKRVSVTV